MKRKYIASAVSAAAIALVLSACGDGDNHGVFGTTGVTPLTPITPTQTVTAPSTTTVTETIKPIEPKPVCADLGWDTTPDTPTRAELRLKPDATVTQPKVDAPLIAVNAWSSQCYDTVEFVINTTLVDSWYRQYDPNYTDHPWFDVRYVGQVMTEGQGAPVSLRGNAALQVVIHAKAASYIHWSGHVPDGLVNASTYNRLTTAPSVKQIKGAGEFEGQFTFGVGVDKERPFAAYYVDNSDGTTSVVVRVMH